MNPQRMEPTDQPSVGGTQGSNVPTMSAHVSDTGEEGAPHDTPASSEMNRRVDASDEMPIWPDGSTPIPVSDPERVVFFDHDSPVVEVWTSPPNSTAQSLVPSHSMSRHGFVPIVRAVHVIPSGDVIARLVPPFAMATNPIV